jgi:hypothetical protein
MTTMKRLCLTIALALPLAAGAAFKCVDERGLTHIGDTPPAGCAKVMMYEVTRSGKVVREIAPTMTEEQVKERAAAAKRKKEEDRIASEQRRKDLALLATYSSENEFDVVRDRTIEPITGRIKVAKSRITEVDKRSAKVQEELEFYKAGKSGKSTRKVEAPPMLVSELERLANERATLEKNIANYEKEIVELQAKFDVDKQRWIAIKAGGATPAPVQPKVVPTAAKK